MARPKAGNKKPGTKNRNNKSSARQVPGKQGQCRIIGGRWRGRKIFFDDAEGLRPTTDRVRETVFNWLQPYIGHSVCLDAFSGSGVLGFEAVSRGAARAVLVEKNLIPYRNIEKNIRELLGDNLDRVIVPVHADVLQWLQSTATARSWQFDLVFLDPPYQHTGLLADVAQMLEQGGCLAEDAIIYVEHAFGEDVKVPSSWQCIRDKHTPQIAYKLFSHQTDGV